MDILSESEIDNIISKSKLISKYNESIDRESAYEILQNKLSDEQQQQQPQVTQKSKSNEKSTFEKILSNTTTRQVGRTLVREITRGLLGALGLGRGRR